MQDESIKLSDQLQEQPLQLDDWHSRHEREVYEALLVHRYVIDIDNTVKPIYGHQEISASRRLPRSGR